MGEIGEVSEISVHTGEAVGCGGRVFVGAERGVAGDGLRVDVRDGCEVADAAMLAPVGMTDGVKFRIGVELETRVEVEIRVALGTGVALETMTLGGACVKVRRGLGLAITKRLAAQISNPSRVMVVNFLRMGSPFWNWNWWLTAKKNERNLTLVNFTGSICQKNSFPHRTWLQS